MRLLLVACVAVVAMAASALAQAPSNEPPPDLIPESLARDGPVTIEVPRDPQFTPLDFARMQPYFGLEESSYGRLDPNFALDRMCNGTVNMRRADVISRGIAGMTDRLMGGIARRAASSTDPEVDPAILNADLQSHFPMLADRPVGMTGRRFPAGVGYVGIIARAERRITFWYNASLIPEAQIQAAAGDYCRRRDLGYQFAGAASHCQDMTRIIRYEEQVGGIISKRTTEFDPNTSERVARQVNPQAPPTSVNKPHTYVIARYDCAGAPAPPPATQ